MFILGQPGIGPVYYTISAVDLRNGHVRTVSIQPNATSAYLAVDARRGRLFLMTIPFPAVNVDVYDATSLRRPRTTAVSNPATMNTGWGSGPSPIVADARTGRVFVSHAESNSVGVLDAVSGRLLRTIVLHPRGNLAYGAPQVALLILAERLDRVYMVDSASGTVNTLDAATGRFLGTLQSGGAGPSWPCFDARTGRVFFVGYCGAIDVRDSTTGRLIQTISPRAATGHVANSRRHAGRHHFPARGDGAEHPGGRGRGRARWARLRRRRALLDQGRVADRPGGGRRDGRA